MLASAINKKPNSVSTNLTAQQKKFIQEATQENIIAWFKENYTTEEDRNSYCRTNGFKPELFINFLEKGDRYVTARFAIFKSMASKILGWEIESKDYVRFLYDYKIAQTWEDIRKKIMDEAKLVRRKFIVIIDGDDLSNDLNLSELIEYYEKKKNLLHVVIVFANGIVNDAIMSHETKDGISIMHSLTNTKDAADTCISLLLGSLHATLHAFFPVVKHSFIVVTKNNSLEELSKQFQLIGRQCFPAKSIKECINILARIEGNDTIEIISKQKVTNSKQTGIAAIKIVEKPASQDLKELFNVAWLGLGKSENQFCKTNNLDSTNFSKHINGKKYNHACKLQLEEFYKTFKTSSTEVSHFVVNIRGHIKELDIYHTYHHGEHGEVIEFEIDSNEFSFTTPHDYNPLIKDLYPVVFEEWMSEDGKYFAQILECVGNSNRIHVKLRGSILTIPLRVYDSSDDKSFPIDIEVRMEKDKPVKLNLVVPIGQVNGTIHTYFVFSHWTPQEVIAQNNEVCSVVTGDLFHKDQPIGMRIYNFSSIFKPFTYPSISNQVFYPEHEIDLGNYQEAQDLISERCVFYKINGEFVLSTRRSLKNGSQNRMILKQTVVDYILKRDSSCEQIDGIIDSVEDNPNLGICNIGCKVL